MFDTSGGIKVTEIPVGRVPNTCLVLYETSEGCELHSAGYHGDPALRLFSCRSDDTVMSYIKQRTCAHEDNEVHLYQANGKPAKTYTAASFEAAS